MAFTFFGFLDAVRAISGAPAKAAPIAPSRHGLTGWRRAALFPRVCPLCGGNMRIIAFITDGVQISKILAHIPAGVRHGNGASGGSRAHARVDRPGCPAAFSPTASPVPAALRAGTTSSLPTPASVAGSAPPAPPAAWWRPQRIWPTMSSRAWPLRQWVLSVPKRLRYHLERDSAVPIAALHFLAAAAAMRLNLLRRLTCAETSFS